jgi:hypothetical protein
MNTKNAIHDLALFTAKGAITDDTQLFSAVFLTAFARVFSIARMPFTYNLSEFINTPN